MHKGPRYRFSQRLRLLKEDSAACEALMAHIDSCPDCKETLCPACDKLYEGFLKAQLRGKFLRGD